MHRALQRHRALARLPVSRCLVSTRLNSNKPPHGSGKTSSYNTDKYRSIDEFNKSKKEFQFGHEESLESRFSDHLDPENALLDDPRLKDLRKGSADYKYQLFMIQQEYQQEQEKHRERYEFYERIKGFAGGALALVGILSVYQLVMNYKYIKSYINHKLEFSLLESKAKDLNDPKSNEKLLAKMVERLSAELDSDFVLGLKDSTSESGIYLFGAASGKKLPARVKGFDGMFFAEVLVKNDYLVAVDESGKVFHYSKKLGQPVQVALPSKISSVLSSGGSFYYLSRNSKDLYVGKEVTETKAPGWFSSGAAYHTDKVALNFAKGERIKSIAAGEEHLLLLTSNGRLFEACTKETPVNKGQFGLPKYSPFTIGTNVPVNSAFELTNLNYSVVSKKDSKEVVPRTFSHIAANKYSNVVSDSHGNLWTWGDNSSAQCGREAATGNDIQAVPKMVHTLKDLQRIAKYSLADKGAKGTFSVTNIFATNDSTILKMRYEVESDLSESQDLLLTFGNGLKGQLGLSRYVHMTGTPQVIKSFVGITEYDERAQRSANIGIKDVAAGGDHIFVTLNNSGPKDVLVFGDNLSGQFGNGKTVKTAKPLELPKLVEPKDFEGRDAVAKKILARKVNDQSTSRLQLNEGSMHGKKVEQVIVAGEDSSAIFYRHQ